MPDDPETIDQPRKITDSFKMSHVDQYGHVIFISETTGIVAVSGDNFALPEEVWDALGKPKHIHVTIENR